MSAACLSAITSLLYPIIALIKGGRHPVTLIEVHANKPQRESRTIMGFTYSNLYLTKDEVNFKLQIPKGKEITLVKLAVMNK